MEKIDESRGPQKVPPFQKSESSTGKDVISKKVSCEIVSFLLNTGIYICMSSRKSRGRFIVLLMCFIPSSNFILENNSLSGQYFMEKTILCIMRTSPLTLRNVAMHSVATCIPFGHQSPHN